RMRHVKAVKAAGLLMAVGLLVTGCGGSGSTGASSAVEPKDRGPAIPSPTGAVPGCGEQAVTDLSKTWPRDVAHCKPGAPAPQPLPEPATITVSIPTKSSEIAGPLMWAKVSGEFEKENLEVKIQVAPSSSAI